MASAHVARRLQSRNAGLEFRLAYGKVSRHHLIPVIGPACIPVIEPAHGQMISSSCVATSPKPASGAYIDW
jgi:hypothetical protein